MKKLAQDFNTAALDLNPGSLSRASKALPLSHCALHSTLCDGWLCFQMIYNDRELISNVRYGYRESMFANVELSVRNEMLKNRRPQISWDV